MIELSGEVVIHPTFYQIEGEGASGAALPTLMMVIPLMVNCDTDRVGGIQHELCL